MASSLDHLIALGTPIQEFLINIASHGIELESQLSILLPRSYPPYLLFFTNPQIRPLDGVQLIEAAYLLGALVVISSLPLFLFAHPSTVRRVTWGGIGIRAVVILGLFWGMMVFVSKAWGVLGPRGDRNANRAVESLDELF
jgi:hypothetical protein